MIKYFKNFILCGEIDYLCLVCEESFQSTSDLEKHIRWEKHRKLIKQQNYFPKFRKDSLYKIGTIFYCELCNYATQTVDSIKVHISEESHKTNKQNPQNVTKTDNKSIIKRFGDFVTVSTTVLSKKEWLGVVDKYCWVCQVKTVNKTEEHVSSISHLVNLIQTQVVVVDNEYYRKLDKATAYCFKCRKAIPFDELSAHTFDHQKDRENKNNNKETNKLYFIDREKNMATCKICNESMELRFGNLYGHKTIHHKNSAKDSLEDIDEIDNILMVYDHGKQRADLKKFGRDNHIKLSSGGRKGYCTLCGTHLSPHVAVFKEHVSGARHTGNLELRGLIKTNKKPEKVYYTTKPYSSFFPDIILLKDPLVAVIKMEFCVHILSLMFLSPLEFYREGEKYLKCYLCDKLITFNYLAHYSKGHKDDIVKTKVITTISGEFIREIRPSLYHCGFCNSVYPSWRLLEKHLRSWQHGECKRHSEYRMEEVIVRSMSSSRQEYREFIESIDVLD